jgi:glucose uptake protein GlcU
LDDRTPYHKNRVACGCRIPCSIRLLELLLRNLASRRAIGNSLVIVSILVMRNLSIASIRHVQDSGRAVEFVFSRIAIIDSTICGVVIRPRDQLRSERSHCNLLRVTAESV